MNAQDDRRSPSSASATWALPMARNLAAAGWTVRGYDPVPAAVDAAA